MSSSGEESSKQHKPENQGDHATKDEASCAVSEVKNASQVSHHSGSGSGSGGGGGSIEDRDSEANNKGTIKSKVKNIASDSVSDTGESTSSSESSSSEAHRKRSHKSSTKKIRKKNKKKKAKKKDRKKKTKKKKDKKRKDKKRKEKKRKRKHRTISGSDDSDENVRYSSITGKKIKLKIDKTRDDVARDVARANYRRFLNSQF